MAYQHHEPQEPYVSYEEVHRWVQEARRIDRQRRYRFDDRLFRAVCYLFLFVLMAYIMMRIMGMA